MSGHKRATITITRDEYDRLRDARDGFHAVPEPPVLVLQDLMQQRNGALENTVLELEQRHAQFQDLLNGMNKNIQQIEKTNGSRLLELQTRTYRHMQQQTGALWNRVETLIDHQNQRFNAALAAQQSQTQKALLQLSNELDQISKSEQRKQVAAHEWLSNNIQFYNFLVEQYACEFFLQGEMGKISREIDLASTNLDTGAYETALAAAQQIHFQLSDLRIALEKLHSEWQMLYIDTWETTLQVLSQAVESMDVPAIDLRGEELPYGIHVDAWVENRLSQLIERIAAFRDLVETEGPSMPTEMLREHREQTIPGFTAELEDLVAQARVNAINAQLRINIADFVIQALQEQGFAPNEAGYQTADAQSAYEVSLSNYEGSAVVVQVKSAGVKIGQNELHLESLDGQARSEDELENRWHAISQSLERFGLSVGPYAREDTSAVPAPRQQSGGKSRGSTRGGQRDIRGGKTVNSHGR